MDLFVSSDKKVRIDLLDWAILNTETGLHSEKKFLPNV